MSETSGLTRRGALERGVAAGGALLLPSLLAACGDDDDSAGGGGDSTTLTYVAYGGVAQECQTTTWLDPYVKAHPNVTIRQDQPTDYAKLEAMVKANRVTWDLVNVEFDYGLGKTTEFLEPIDCSVVSCSEIPDEFRGTHRIGHVVYSTVLAYRTDKFPSGQGPRGWEDFFDVERYPGKRGAYENASGHILEAALVADGVSPDSLYPIDYDRAFSKLDTIKDDIVWWDSGAVSTQLLADGEVSMGMAWNGRVFDLHEQGVPVAIAWDGNFFSADYLVIPKGSPNAEAAMQLAAYITSAKHAARYSACIPYGPTNEKAVAKVSPKNKDWVATTHRDVAILPDDKWWDENREDGVVRFREWLGS